MMGQRRHKLLPITLACILTACVSSPVDDKPKPVADADFFMHKGVETYHQGSYRQSIAWFERALLLHESLDQRDGIAKSHLNLAELNMIVNQDKQAFDHLKLAQNVILTDSLSHLKPHLHLLASSYELRQHQYQDALGLINTYMTTSEASADVQTAFIANRVKVALALEPQSAPYWIEQYESKLSQNDIGDSGNFRLQRFKLQANLTKPSAEQYESILNYYRGQASKVNIAETLVEWANHLHSIGQIPEAKERLARAAKIRLLMGDKIGSETLIKRIESL